MNLIEEMAEDLVTSGYPRWLPNVTVVAEAMTAALVRTIGRTGLQRFESPLVAAFALLDAEDLEPALGREAAEDVITWLQGEEEETE